MNKTQKKIQRLQTFSFYTTSSAEKRIAEYIKANKIILKSEKEKKLGDEIEQFYVQVRSKEALNLLLMILAGNDFVEADSTRLIKNKDKLSKLDLSQFTFKTLTVKKFEELIKKFNNHIPQMKEAINQISIADLDKQLNQLVVSKKLSYSFILKNKPCDDKSKLSDLSREAKTDVAVFEVQNYFIIAVFKKQVPKQELQQPKRGKQGRSSNKTKDTWDKLFTFYQVLVLFLLYYFDRNILKIVQPFKYS